MVGTRVRFGDQEELKREAREERGRPRLVTNPNFTIYKEGGAGFTKYTVYTGQERMVRPRSLPPRDRKRPVRAPSVEQFLSNYRASPAGPLAALGHTLHPSQVLVQLTSSSHYQISQVISDSSVPSIPKSVLCTTILLEHSCVKGRGQEGEGRGREGGSEREGEVQRVATAAEERINAELAAEHRREREHRALQRSRAGQ